MLSQSKIQDIYNHLLNKLNLLEIDYAETFDDYDVLELGINIDICKEKIKLLKQILEVEEKYKFSDDLPLSLLTEFVSNINFTLDVLHPSQRPIAKLTIDNINNFIFKVNGGTFEIWEGYKITCKKLLPYIIKVK